MREILFRGKTEQGKWLYGFYHNETSIESPSSDRKITRHHIYTQDFDRFVIPETIGQFTGLTDKNGKKIFEGDIVKDLGGSMDGIPRVVFWNEEWMEFECCLVKKHWAYGTNCCRLWCIKDKELEVIGNKWDNPELLGE